MEQTILSVLQVLSALAVVGLVLLQQGKGADMGASFGSGASQTLFGSTGSGNFMTRATAVCAVVFFSASIGLAYISKQQAANTGQLDFSTFLPESDNANGSSAVEVEALVESDLPSGLGPQVKGVSEIERDLPVVSPSSVENKYSVQSEESVDAIKESEGSGVVE